MRPGEISRNAGASRAQRSMACGQRGWKWHPGGGASGARVIETTITGDGTRLRAEVALATTERGSWRITDGKKGDVLLLVLAMAGVCIAGFCACCVGLLIATPVARVLFTVVAFALEGDRTYVAIASLVLLVLAGSLFGLW